MKKIYKVRTTYQKIGLVILFILMFLLCALNTVKDDYARYKISYDLIGQGGASETDLMYLFCCKIFNSIGFSFQQFHVTFYLVIFLIFLRCFLDYAKKPVIAALSFAIFPYLIFSVQMRDAMASVLCMYGIRFLTGDKLKDTLKYIVTIFVAALFHGSCIIYIVFLISKKHNFKELYKCLLIFEFFITYIFSRFFLHLFSLFGLERFERRYSMAPPISVVIRHSLPVVLLTVVILYCLWGSKHHLIGVRKLDKILERCSLIVCSFIIFIGININLFRLVYFMLPIVMITITNFADNGQKRIIANDKYILKFFTIAFSVMYFVLLLGPRQQKAYEAVTKTFIPWL